MQTKRGYDITGIIDWEWVYTDSKSAAFNSTIVLLPVAEFYDGVTLAKIK